MAQYVGPKNVGAFEADHIHGWASNPSSAGLTPLDPYDALQSELALVRYVNDQAERRNSQCVDLTEKFLGCVAIARKFISLELGRAPDTPIYSADPQNNPDSSRIGVYDSLDDTCTISDPTSGHKFNEATRRSVLVKTLVHELAHASAGERELVYITQASEDGYLDVADYAVAFGMRTLSVKANKITVLGTFFEEAFAEAMAAKWYENAILRGKDGSLPVPTPWGTSLPLRYHSVREGPLNRLWGSKGISSTAFAAYAIELLSGVTGINFLELIKQSRTPNTGSRHQFIQALNSVRPGLYAELRNLQCSSPDDYKNGFAIVQEAIA